MAVTAFSSVQYVLKYILGGIPLGRYTLIGVQRENFDNSERKNGQKIFGCPKTNTRTYFSAGINFQMAFFFKFLRISIHLVHVLAH